ncbi:hypothetical protein [Thauera propionica]|uniref:hypothetical protein n=1 Tax=Thauera propionica TaxID=2019431 RepID=UPI0023F32842|nr:hypothetical protein [Thauera propionica]MDD3675822.1 hypothetical protein [Thauera propionica]
MRERPILFSAPMVRAILDGRKTQTRRVVKDRHIDAAPPACFFQWLRERCPYGQPGDRLWVKETFFDTAPFRDAPLFESRATPIAYRADNEFIGCHKWRPSIHMPRRASRITLEINAVRVERLHEINAADAKSEGIEGQFEGGPWRNYQRDGHWFPEGKDTAPVLSYRTLWEKINGPGSWDANPWVWVIEVKRVEDSK